MRGIAQVNSKYFSVFMLSLLIKKKFLCYHFVHFLNFSHTSLLLLIGLNDTFFLKKWASSPFGFEIFFSFSIYRTYISKRVCLVPSLLKKFLQHHAGKFIS